MKNTASFPQDKIPSRFSPTVYYFSAIFLVNIGLASSGYLALSHYRNYMDIGYQSFCAISRSLNCDTVSQSPYAVFSGVPVAVWGAGGYLLLLCMLIMLRVDKPAPQKWGLLCLLSIIFSLISVALASVSHFFIHSYCLMCILTYAVNFLMVVVTWLAQRRFGTGSLMADMQSELYELFHNRFRIAIVGGFFILLACIAVLFYPKYWHFNALPKGEHIATGTTADGSPWIGAQNPSLTITEFTDYMCFQCGKMHSHLRQLVSVYPDRIRLVHKHFPLDRSVNPVLKETVYQKSGLLSVLAIFAQENGMFWQVNDLLLRDAREKKTINFSSIAKEIGLDISNIHEKLNNKKLITKLARDIRDGGKLGVAGTPSYEIDGKLYSGTIPEKVLAPVLKGN